MIGKEPTGVDRREVPLDLADIASRLRQYNRDSFQERISYILDSEDPVVIENFQDELKNLCDFFQSARPFIQAMENKNMSGDICGLQNTLYSVKFGSPFPDELLKHAVENLYSQIRLLRASLLQIAESPTRIANISVSVNNDVTQAI